MTSLISMVMVVVMAFSSIGGMTAGLEETTSFDAKISVNREMLAMMLPAQPTAEELSEAGEEAEAAAPDAATVISDALSVLTIRGIADKGTAELDLFANEDAVISLGMKTTEQGSVFASNLLGKNVLAISPEMMAQLQQMAGGMTGTASMTVPGAETGALSGTDPQVLAEQLQSIDPEQAMKDIQAVMDDLTKAIEEKTGDTETGTFEVDGSAYAAKTPLNITYEELTELVLNSVKELLGKESMKPLADAMTASFSDPDASIDKELEKLKETLAEKKTELSAASYATEDGVKAYYTLDLSRAAEESAQEENIHIGLGTRDGATRLVLSAADGTALDLNVTGEPNALSRIQATVTSAGTTMGLDVSIENGAMTADLDLPVQGMPMKAHIVTVPEGDRTNYQADIFMGGMEASFVSVTGSFGKGGEPVCVYEGEDLKEIPFENLMSTEDTTAATQIQTTLALGLMNAVTTLKKNLPEATGAWLMTQFAMLMSPGGSTTPQTQPATGD